MPMFLRRLAAFVLAAVAFATLALVGLAGLAGPAGAQVAPDGNASPDAPASAVFTVNNSLVTLIVGLVIPLVVGLVARDDNPAWIKVGLAAAVTAVANLFVQAIQSDGTAVLSQEWLLQAAIMFATALGSYARIWRPITRDAGTTPNSLVTSGGLIPITRAPARVRHVRRE